MTSQPLKTSGSAAVRYQNLFDASQDGILILSFDTGAIENANPFISTLLGFSKEELLGKKLWEIGTVLDRDAALAAFKVLKGHGYIRYNNLPLISKTGKVIEVEFIANVYDLDHHPIIQCLIRDIEKQKNAERVLAEYQDLVAVSFEEMANTFSALVEKRDSFTAGHQIRVAKLALAIGVALKCEPHMLDGISFAAKIHDIGKMSVPIEILTKPNALNDFEVAVLRNHAQVGFDVVKNMKFPWPIAEAILQYHERLNGSGYPNQIKNGEIIFEARVLAVADTVEAMSSHRPYRSTPGLDAALDTIKAGSGTLFDPLVVNACIQVFKDGFKFNGLLVPKSYGSSHL